MTHHKELEILEQEAAHVARLWDALKTAERESDLRRLTWSNAHRALTEKRERLELEKKIRAEIAAERFRPGINEITGGQADVTA